MTITRQQLIQEAMACTEAARPLAGQRARWEWMAYVGAALETEGGNVYTGINLSLFCGIGFCAEHSAIAEALKHGETRIIRIVAVTTDGAILPPCGRCRELIYQLDEANSDTEVVLPGDHQLSLGELLPLNWQKHVDLTAKSTISGSQAQPANAGIA
jgi:cytidine deaminase